MFLRIFMPGTRWFVKHDYLSVSLRFWRLKFSDSDGWWFVYRAAGTWSSLAADAGTAAMSCYSCTLSPAAVVDHVRSVSLLTACRLRNTHSDQLISCPLPGDDQMFVGRYRGCRLECYHPPSPPRPLDCHSKPNGRNLNFAFFTTLKSLDYNVVMTFRFNNDNNNSKAVGYRQ